MTTPLTSTLAAWRAVHEARANWPGNAKAIVLYEHTYAALLEVAAKLSDEHARATAKLAQIKSASDEWFRTASYLYALDNLLAPLTEAAERGA